MIQLAGYFSRRCVFKKHIHPKHLRSPKVARSHTSHLRPVGRLVRTMTKLDSVKKVILGEIVTHVSRQKRIKYKSMLGGLEIHAYWHGCFQKIHVYTKRPEDVYCAINKVWPFTVEVALELKNKPLSSS